MCSFRFAYLTSRLRPVIGEYSISLARETGVGSVGCLVKDKNNIIYIELCTCYGIVTDLHATVIVTDTGGGSMLFKNQAILNCPIQKRDFEAVLLNDKNEITGLICGEGKGSLGVANDIENVLNALNISLVTV